MRANLWDLVEAERCLDIIVSRRLAFEDSSQV